VPLARSICRYSSRSVRMIPCGNRALGVQGNRHKLDGNRTRAGGPAAGGCQLQILRMLRELQRPEGTSWVLDGRMPGAAISGLVWTVVGSPAASGRLNRSWPPTGQVEQVILPQAAGQSPATLSAPRMLAGRLSGGFRLFGLTNGTETGTMVSRGVPDRISGPRSMVMASGGWQADEAISAVWCSVVN